MTTTANLCQENSVPPEESTVTRLTEAVLLGTPDPEDPDAPRYCWLSSRAPSLAVPLGSDLLSRFGLSGADDVVLSMEDARVFLTQGRWNGVCVERPGQELAATLADHLSPAAAQIGRVNLLLRECDGTVTGDFTLGTGLSRLLPSLGVPLTECRALLLADDETDPLATGLVRLLKHLGAPAAQVVGIDAPLSAEALAALPGAKEATLLINGSHFGAAPNFEEMPITTPETLQALPALRAVLDLVDDPVRTRLVWNAQRMGLAARSALGLRIVEAREAAELFIGRTLPFCATRSILADIRREATNIVLIGMPGCGKTTVGKALAAKLLREFVDIDALVEQRVGKSSTRIYREEGEEFFRQHETAVIESLAGRHGLVISTGGGACLRPRNRMLLALNGTFFWMQRPLSKLSTYRRPLSQERGVETLYEERSPIYRALAERIITVKSVEETVSEIIGEDEH